MAEFPSLPLWTDAYLADTRHLSTLEHGAYLLLLMEAWRRPSCSLPNDDKLLARLAGLSVDEWKEIEIAVMSFWTYDGRKKEWTQSRLVKEREYVASKSRSQRDKAAKRWNTKKKSDAAAMPEGMPERCPDDAPTPTPTKEKEPKGSSKKGTRLPPDFKPDQEWARATGISHKLLVHEFQKFCDYWNGKSGKDATKVDWQATWRNWVRNSNAFQQRNLPAASRPKTVGDGFVDLARDMGILNDGKPSGDEAGLFEEGNAGRNGPVLDLVDGSAEPGRDEPDDFTKRLLHRA